MSRAPREIEGNLVDSLAVAAAKIQRKRQTNGGEECILVVCDVALMVELKRLETWRPWLKMLLNLRARYRRTGSRLFIQHLGYM